MARRAPRNEGWLANQRDAYESYVLRSKNRMNHEEIEQRCLDEAKRRVSHPAAESLYRKRFESVTLEGKFPETRVVLTGEHAYGGAWTIRFPVWDENHAIAPRADVPPDYRRFISFLDIDIREK